MGVNGINAHVHAMEQGDGAAPGARHRERIAGKFIGSAKSDDKDLAQRNVEADEKCRKCEQQSANPTAHTCKREGVSDESIERGSRVMQLISELEAGETPGELPAGESLPTPSPRILYAEDIPSTTVPGSVRDGGRAVKRPRKHGATRAAGPRATRGR